MLFLPYLVYCVSSFFFTGILSRSCCVCVIISSLVFPAVILRERARPSLFIPASCSLFTLFMIVDLTVDFSTVSANVFSKSRPLRCWLILPPSNLLSLTFVFCFQRSEFFSYFSPAIHLLSFYPIISYILFPAIWIFLTSSVHLINFSKQSRSFLID